MIARVIRSGFVESLHQGTTVAVDADGDVVATAGSGSTSTAYGGSWTVQGSIPHLLQNPPDLPYDEDERIGWRLAGRLPSPLAHNCSGTHAAMLATCVENGWSTAAYLQPDHLLQQLLTETTVDLAGEPVAATGVDTPSGWGRRP